MPTKTWTTTADFDTGTPVGLITTGDELALTLGAGTWSIGGNLSTGRFRTAGCGTQVAGL